MYKYGFIGGGNMGGALAQAAAAAVGGESVLLCDRDEETTAALARKLGVTAATYAEIAAQCRMVFAAVKPNLIVPVLERLRELFGARSNRVCVVSIAAGVKIADMRRALGADTPIIRMMQNTPVALGAGMMVYATSPEVRADDIEALRASMRCAGRLDALPEDKIDAATAVMGCGPAFAYMFAEALADGGVHCGLARDGANLYAAQMLLGAAEMLLQSGMTPGALKDAVCSPGGSTIEGVRVLEEQGMRGAVMDAVVAAFRKTQQLG